MSLISSITIKCHVTKEVSLDALQAKLNLVFSYCMHTGKTRNLLLLVRPTVVATVVLRFIFIYEPYGFLIFYHQNSNSILILTAALHCS